MPTSHHLLVCRVILVALCLPVVLSFSYTPVHVLSRSSASKYAGSQAALQQQSLAPTGVTARRVRGEVALRALGGDTIKQTLREYGLAAVCTHFIGFVILLGTIFTALNAIGPQPIMGILPEGIKEHIDGTEAVSIVELQIAFALTEAVGPVRLGVTLAVAPTVSKILRQYTITRNLEAIVFKASRRAVRGAIAAKKPDIREVIAAVHDQLRDFGLKNRIP